MKRMGADVVIFAALRKGVWVVHSRISIHCSSISLSVPNSGHRHMHLSGDTHSWTSSHVAA